MTEAGFPQVGYHPGVWMGVFAPAGTPAAVVEKLNRDINAVMQSAEMAPALQRFGYQAKVMSPAEFATFFADELKKCRRGCGRRGSSRSDGGAAGMGRGFQHRRSWRRSRRGNVKRANYPIKSCLR